MTAHPGLGGKDRNGFGGPWLNRSARAAQSMRAVSRILRHRRAARGIRQALGKQFPPLIGRP